MIRRPSSISVIVAVQVVFVAAFGIAWAGLSTNADNQLRTRLAAPVNQPVVDLPRSRPLTVAPLYDDPQLVSDEQLAAVLLRIRPKFDPRNIKPNFVEHALRTWRADAEFTEPGIMSGREMVEFLTDHGKYLISWGNDVPPLLVDRSAGVDIRWGKDAGASVHHDHWLASLTEAGVERSHPLQTPAQRDMTLEAALQQALRDFRLDERETEWSAMAFGLWLPPQRSWKTADGRVASFDMLARRLLRGHKQFGVCRGTHRVYSMMLILRLDDEFDILSEGVHDEVYRHLETVRDLIVAAQFPDGRWPHDWWRGEEALESPGDADVWQSVIATGHHLEWLAIAPQELHPPREQTRNAAQWVINNTTEQSAEQILKRYTFYTHVGNALALWRNTRPPEFWRQWRKTYPHTAAPSK